MSLTQTLLARIDAFLADSDMAATAFGVAALNDGKFVNRLRSGSGVTVKTIDRVNSYIDAEREKHPEWKRRRRRAPMKAAA